MPASPMTLARAAFLATGILAAAGARGATVDWQALAQVHAQALDRYRGTPANERGPARAAACGTLKAAGADRAVSAPVSGIPPTQAAAILNDFGFLATPDCAPWPLPELAIRRALALDPRRNVAHRNLADLLRADLQSVVRAGTDPDSQRAEIRREYQAFIRGGGARTSDMAGWPDPPPEPGPPADACRIVKAYLDAGRLEEIRSDSAEHLRVGPRLVHVSIRYEGTGLAPTVAATDEAGDGTEEILANGDPRAEAAILGIGGDVQVMVLDRGMESGSTVSLVGHAGCDISRERGEAVSPESAEPAVCRRLVAHGDVREVAFGDSPAIPDEALAARWTGEYSGVHAVGTALVDVANTGQPVRMLLMETTLRQPDACTVQLHEILAADGRRLATGAERAALGRQGIQADDPSRHDADCYGETHYLVDGARTLVESREHPQGDPATPEGRKVAIDERGRWRQLCATRSLSRWIVEPAAAARR